MEIIIGRYMVEQKNVEPDYIGAEIANSLSAQQYAKHPEAL